MDVLCRTQLDKKSLNWPIQELGHVIFHEFFKFPMDVCPKFLEGTAIFVARLSDCQHPSVKVRRRPAVTMQSD